MLEPGDKLHIITRRAFENDLRRHFVGVVLASTNAIVKLDGWVFVLDNLRLKFVKRPERRVRIFSLVDASNIIAVLPDSVKLDKLEYVTSDEKRLVVTDGSTFRLDINEFGAVR